MTTLTVTPQLAFRAGVRTIAPLLLGVLPFGLVVGVVAAEVEITAVQALGQSFFIYAGAVQLVMLDLLSKDAPLWVILVSTTMLNLRYVIYSASLAPHYKPLSAAWKLLLSFLTVDQVYAFAQALFAEQPELPNKQWYHLGLTVPIAILWLIATAVGFYLGEIIPDSWSLTFVVPLMFLSIVVPAIKDKSYLAAALTATVIALLTTELPYNLGLIVAAFAGILAGVAIGSRT